MPTELLYDPSAARSLLKPSSSWDELKASLLAARDEVQRDVDLMNSGEPAPAEKQPLDAGFIELPAKLLAESKDGNGLLGEIQASAARLRARVDNVVLLGIGGSYMGARALFEAIRHPYHNDLPRSAREDVPRLYFEGNNLDNDAVTGLLELLAHRCRDKTDLDQRWGLVVISKSGGTLETAAAFRVFREALEQYYGLTSDESRKLIVPITGAEGKLRELAETQPYPDVFPIPEGVGGRFSVLTAVGLYPAALLGLDVERLLRGAAAMTERFFNAPFGDNPVLDYTAIAHLFEREHGMNLRVLSTWGGRLEAVGLWYDQLLAESLGKQECGATPITAVNTRDLHSRGQQHQEGTRDKLITNLIADQPSRAARGVPQVPPERDLDDLNKLEGKTFPDLLEAAFAGTNRAYADDRRPTANIVLPQLDEFALGELLQMLMLATVLEGRLIGINPYGQPGVEAYKRNMMQILAK